jgi:hypothetical protein
MFANAKFVDAITMIDREQTRAHEFEMMALEW